MLESEPAIINLHLQVSRLHNLELPYKNQAAYLLLDAVKPTHRFPGLTKRGTNPREPKMPALRYGPEL